MRVFCLLLFLITAAAITGCNEPAPAPKSKPASLPELANAYVGKVFFFAPKLDKTTCEVYGDCECCWDNLLFIDDVRFIRIYYCDADQDYRSGTYSVRNDSIFLIYNSTELEHEQNWNYDDEDLEDSLMPGGFTFTTESLDQLLDTIATIDCNGEKRLKTGYDEVFFGQPDIIKPLKDYLKELKTDSIFQRLDISA